MIRHGLMDDLDELSNIESVSYPVAEGASKESIRARLDVFSDYFWVLEKDRIIGFINGLITDVADLTDEMYDNPTMHDPKGEWLMIFSVVVHPDYRHHGYASSLMRRVIEDVKAEGHKGIVLTCKEHLIPFYSSFGYKNEGISSSVHGDAVWYQMRLTF